MRLLCDAIAFCYGPGVVLEQVLRAWRPCVDHITLVGIGTTLELLGRTELIDQVLEIDTECPSALAEVPDGYDILFSVCNPVGFAALRRKARYTIFWDFLLWMRSQGDAAEFDADCYVVEMFLGCERALVRWGGEILNPVRCPAVVDRVAYGPRPSESLLLNFGGQRSKLTQPGSNTDYPSLLTGAVRRAVDRCGFRGPVSVTADAQTVDELAERFSRTAWNFESLAHEAFLSKIDQSSRVLTHPGLYSPLEAMGRGRPVFLLPSSNYTQVLQLRDFRAEGVARRSFEWEDATGVVIPWGLPESEGVRQVLEQVRAGAERAVLSQLEGALLEFLSLDDAELQELVEEQERAVECYFGDFRNVLAEIFDVARAELCARGGQP